MSESSGKTLIVATVLCGVCSVLVAGAVVVLRPYQTKNKELDFKKNILISADLYQDGIDVVKTYQNNISPVVVDLSTGDIKTDIDATTFDQEKAEKDSDLNEKIDVKADVAGIKKRSKLQKVYMVNKEGALDQVILHIYGKGLWSTMYGFLSLDKDLKTIRGLNYYAHGETPGLGGEIQNPRWKSLWTGKVAFDENGNPAIDVIKGSVSSQDPEAKYKVDGLSGATLTANGVENTFTYWLSDNGYGKFLKKMKEGEDQ